MVDGTKKTTVLYHADADGFGAAFVIWLSIGYGAKYIPVQYGEAVPNIPEGTEVLYIVDFSYKRAICEELNEKYELHIYDHHKTAEAELEGLPYAFFNMRKSGCAITWDATQAGPLPLILQYVQDYDLWKFELLDSELINLYIQSLPHDFDIWQHKLNSSDFQSEAWCAGVAIRLFRDGQINYTLKNVRMMRISINCGVHIVPVVNASSNVSEIGNEMCKVYPYAPFSASYCDRRDIRTWSLRSIGDFDVSVIARMFGGGGHKNAAGFSMEIGWPQTAPDEFLNAFEEAAE